MNVLKQDYFRLEDVFFSLVIFGQNVIIYSKAVITA